MLDTEVTILIPTSPVKSHPDTGIIDHVIASCRFHFPTARIIIMMDGVRREQEEYRVNYMGYCAMLKEKYKKDFGFVESVPQIHQVALTRWALEGVSTPFILFVEHDTPIVTDEPVEWNGIFDTVRDGTANSIRLLHEAHILEAHKSLTLETITHAGIRLTKTLQWSQRPHLARADFYRTMLKQHFSSGANTFIEDKMHSVAQTHPWEYCKLMIYNPNDTNIKRSYHTDGREGDKKFDMVF